jgi:alpha-1,2-mannosyltransferase
MAGLPGHRRPDLATGDYSIYTSLRISGHRGFRYGALAFGLAAVALWLEPVYMTMFFGQINLILLALIVVDLSLPDSRRWKGIGIGIAAGAKLTPLIFIPYLLASRRVRAAVVGTLSFAATAVIGFVALPAASRQYWGGKFAGNGGLGQLLNQSVDGAVQRLLHGDPAASKLRGVLAIVVAAAGLATAAVASRRGLELLGSSCARSPACSSRRSPGVITGCGSFRVLP